MYQVVIERIVRARSGALRVLPPTRYLLWAEIRLWWELLLLGECNYWIMDPEQAADLINRRYRNWLGERRIEK